MRVREYELVYIVQPDATPEKEKDLQARVGDLVTQAGGITLLWDDWGKRKLAYEIKKFQKGHYMLVNFLGDGQVIPELERMLRLDAEVLRFLTVKVAEQVLDVNQRITEAKKEEGERARKREERERLEAERAAREGGERRDDGEDVDDRPRRDDRDRDYRDDRDRDDRWRGKVDTADDEE
jgi:small subunit ribosomal protein S6